MVLSVFAIEVAGSELSDLESADIVTRLKKAGGNFYVGNVARG